MSPAAEATVRAAESWVLDAENPWPGLESFRERDARFFRGRRDEAEKLRRLVHRDRLSVLYGPSGLGKSSLLQAGLFPLVRDEMFLPVHIRLDHADHAVSMRNQVLAAIAEEAARSRVESPAPRPDETLWEYFHRDRNAFWTAQNEQCIPLLVFDQLEEAFTIGRDTRERELRIAAFLDEFADLAEGRPSLSLKRRMSAGEVNPREFLYDRHDYKILLVIREDFLAQLETLKAKVPSVMGNRMGLAPLNGKSALQVTGAGGTRLIPGPRPGQVAVGEQIVRLVAGKRGDDGSIPLEELLVDPALLSLFCRELNERRKAEGLTGITADLVQGSRDRILAGYYTRSIGDLGPEVRRFVEDKLLNVKGHRNSEDFDNAVDESRISREALNTLIARRLIRREERDRRVRIELTHDVLTEVVRQSRDLRRGEEEAEARAERARLEAEALAQQERNRAEQERRQAEARAERERERAEQARELAEQARREADARAELERERAEQARERAEQERREAMLVRRLLRFSFVAIVVCLALSAAAVHWARSAKSAEGRAVRAQGELKASKDSTDKVNVDRAKTIRALGLTQDSLRRKERADSARSASLRQSNATLASTVASLKRAEAQVHNTRLKALVDGAAADHYLSLTGRVHGLQAMQDEVRRKLQVKIGNAEASLAQSETRARILISAICGPPPTGDKGAPEQDLVPLHVRERANADLVRAGFGALECPTRPGQRQAPAASAQ